MKNEALYREVQGKDLFAMEAKYHPSCRNTFNTEYQNHMREREIRNPLLAQKKKANQNSYLVVKDYILRNILDGKEVVQLSFLCSLFNKDLVSQGFPNPDYRNERLMKRLQADEDISHKLAFCKVPLRGCVELYLVYSSSISVAEAVSCAYKLGTADQLHDAALTLHALILKAFKESKELTWPPTAQELNSVQMEELLPEDLVTFLNLVLTGRAEIGEKCEKTQRLVYSISQDLCRAATNSKWKLPKHILLCATVRHLYRSKQVSNQLTYYLLGHVYCLTVFWYLIFTNLIKQITLFLCSSLPSLQD